MYSTSFSSDKLSSFLRNQQLYSQHTLCPGGAGRSWHGGDIPILWTFYGACNTGYRAWRICLYSPKGCKQPMETYLAMLGV